MAGYLFSCPRFCDRLFQSCIQYVSQGRSSYCNPLVIKTIEISNILPPTAWLVSSDVLSLQNAILYLRNYPIFFKKLVIFLS